MNISPEMRNKIAKFKANKKAWYSLVILAFLFVHIFGFTFSPKDIQISVTVKELLGNFF